jgi:hypothetical protein
MMRTYSIEFLAYFLQALLNEFVVVGGVVLVVIVICRLPEILPASESIVRLIPVVEARSEDEFEFHAVVCRHG